MSFGGVSQAVALFALTFLSEDAAVLSAAVLVAGGMLPWELGFAACFLGIWLGDLWLYGMARAFGAPFVGRFGKAGAVERSRVWFARRGSLVLVVSRFVPGLRLPSYLAAGAMRFPWRSFASVTGLVAAIWVSAILLGGHFLGAARIPSLRERAPWLALGAAVLAIAVAWSRRLWGAHASRVLATASPPSRTSTTGGNADRLHPSPLHLAGSSFRRDAETNTRDACGTRRLRARYARWLQWEFWPAWLFYAPVAGMYLWLALRHRSFTLPTAANPGLPMGGLVGESKFETLHLLQTACPHETAQTWRIDPGAADDRFAELHIVIESQAVALPFILKPDVGQRGVGVKLIRSLDSARDYLAAVRGPVLLQRYAPGPREVGVFYYRLPEEATGHLFAITEKIFPTIAGDGERTVEALILADPRAAIVAPTYLRRFARLRHAVLARGQTLKLVEAGNHAQGCIFRDGMHLATPELRGALDRISCSVPGFFIGRYDIRYASDDDLRAGRRFTIVELNGAGAEATSIYDARHSLRSAYRTLYRQWALVFRIGAAHRARGHRPASLRTLLRDWRRTSALIAEYPAAD